MSYADSLWYTWFAPHLHDKRKEKKKGKGMKQNKKTFVVAKVLL
jgi:hypothetical protein